MKTRWNYWVVVVFLVSACTPARTTTVPTATLPQPANPSPSPIVVTQQPAPPQHVAESAADLTVQPLTTLSFYGSVPTTLREATVVHRDAKGTELSRQVVPADAGVIQFKVTSGGVLGPATITILDGDRVVVQPKVIHTLVADSTLLTDVPLYTDIYTQTTSFLRQSSRTYQLNGTTVNGYRSPDNPLFWLRDHVYQGRGFRYIESDVKSLLDAFAAAQLPDGSVPDWVDNPALGVKAGRKEVEADVEFLFVQGIYEAWQMSGDDAWMIEKLPHARAAIAYTTSDPVRWDATRGLIRRPYTIDMWDFSYGKTTTHPDTGISAPRHWIDDATVWGTFHGDNTGLVQALRMLATMEQRANNPEAAKTYQQQAEVIQKRITDLSWNGSFFRHFVPEDPAWKAPGVDEATQLSLSNAYALNRGVLSGPMIQTVLATYYARGQANPTIALPWYSIDPPSQPGVMA